MSGEDGSPKMMKTIVYGKPNIQFKLKPIPIPSLHETLVRVFAAGLNPVDAKGVVGDKFPHTWTTLRYMSDRAIAGWTIGFEFSGQVVDCPSNKYQPGDEVYGSMPPLGGTLSEYICAPLDQIFRKPAKLTHEQAASLVLVGMTAIQALRPEFDKGCSSILIVGASGGTGHVSVQVSRCLGASMIVGLCSARNTEFVKSCGATHVVNYNSDDFLEKLHRLGPFDVIFDCVTSSDPQDYQFMYPKRLLPICTQRYLRLGGTSIEWWKAGCERIFGGNWFGKEKLFWIRFPNSSQDLKQLTEWSEQLRLVPKVSTFIKFTPVDVQDAFDQINNRRVKGKLVVVIVQSNKII